MSRLHRVPFAILFVLTAFAALPARVDAGHRSPLYCAADRYREAVREFERLVLRTRYIERCDERLVDDLEDSTSRLRSATRDPERYERLCQRFAETEALHVAVESVFYATGKYPVNPQIDVCWSVVANAHAVLVEQMRCIGGGGYGHAAAACASGVSIANHARVARRVGGIPGPVASYGGPQGYRVQGYRGPVAVPLSADRYGVDAPYGPAEVYGRGVEPSNRGAALERRSITTTDELRSAVIGALLQRLQ